MKVGTDAILLGAWCDITGVNRILDVGTGSGVIALLMASRSKAIVHAVELDEKSVKEAKINFNNFQGKKPIVFHDDFINFAKISNQKYDLIVSNPPFFSEGLVSEKESRKAARHTNTLNHQNLCKSASSLISNKGKFCVVLPYNISNIFIEMASSFGLYLHKQLVIYPKPNTMPNRINIEFRVVKSSNIITEKVIIRDNEGEHTNQYKKYVIDYLMKI